MNGETLHTRTLTAIIMLILLSPLLALARCDNLEAVACAKAYALLRHATSKDDLESALSKCQEALNGGGRPDSGQCVAHTASTIGNIQLRLSRYREALGSFEQSLAVFQKVGDAAKEAETQNKIGEVHWYLGEYHRAQDCFQKSLSIAQKLRDSNSEGNALGSMGGVHWALGDYDKALACFDKSLSIASNLGNTKREGVILNNKGEVYRALGEYKKALDHFEKSLDISRNLGDVSGEGIYLSNIGEVYSSWGQYRKALEYYEKSLLITNKLGDLRAELVTLNNIGQVYATLGLNQKALEYYDRSLVISRQLGNVEGEGLLTLNNMGAIHRSLKQNEKALEFYQQSLTISQKGGLAVNRKGSLDAMGNVYLDMGKPDKAEPYLKEADNPGSLGRSAFGNGQYQLARDQYERLLKLCEQNRDVDNCFVAYTGIGKSYEALEDYGKAEEYYEKGMNLVEELRSGLLPSERKNFFEVRIGNFERSEPAKGLTRVKMKLNQGAGSMDSSEATRARAFADGIARRSESGVSGVPKPVLEKEEQIVSRLAALKKELARTDRDKQTGKYEILSKEAQAADADLKSFIEMLWKKYRPYAAVKYPRPVALKESALRPAEYVVTFDVSAEGVGVKLIKGKEILQTAYAKWNRDDLEKDVQEFRQAFETQASNRAQFNPELGYRLYKRLLAPVVGEVPEGKPLVIMPDGVLAVLPFEALITGGKATWSTNQWGDYPQGLTYLGDVHPISYYQSITALTLARTLGEKRKSSERVLVIADPVFQLKDPRAQGATSTRVAQNEQNQRIELMTTIEAAAQGSFKFRELPLTDALAKELEKLYGGSCETITGLKASKDYFLKTLAPQLDQYSAVVFATHGLFSTKVPGLLEPFLALTMVPPGTDGYLTMSDVMSLKMNADVVALTACQTGLGKDLSGEGVMSMGRAFQYAGAKSVLMSLWSVADKSSVQLTESFFRYRKSGKTKLESLKLAREEIRKAGFEHPFFWAAFILVGETD